MNKLIVSLALAASLFSGSVAAAQAYYPSNTGCVSVQTGLGVGARGANVSTLQSFLVAQNYPGSGSWMVTGYFGSATAAALRNFQQLQGLPQSGSVDAATASAISRVSCGGVVSPASPAYPYTYPTIPTSYPPSYSYPSYLSYYGAAPAITSLSQNTGIPGNVVTIYGVGFDLYNNTVNFGGTSIPGIASSNGTSLTFTVPSYPYTYSLTGMSLQLSVTSSRGTSNTINFTLWGSPNACQNGVYGYGICGGCNPNPYLYGGSNSYCYPQPQSTTPTISYLLPNSGGVGTSVTIYGSGFSSSNNSIRFGNGVIANVASNDGRSVSFVVPAYLSGFGTQPITLSTYQVTVVNANGIVSNSVPFSVTSTGSSGQPVISSVTGPTSLATGQQGLWTVNVNTGNNAYLTFSANWGDQNLYGATPLSQQYGAQQQNTLTHTYYTPGTYTIVFTVSNNLGQQNTYTTTVTVGGSGYYGVPSISYLSPNAGSVGQQVTIYGSGFAQYSTVLFGQAVIPNVYSANGTIMTFIVPSVLGPVCNNYVCPQSQYPAPVTPGTYNVSVQGQSGTSNAVVFTVQ